MKRISIISFQNSCFALEVETVVCMLVGLACFFHPHFSFVSPLPTFYEGLVTTIRFIANSPNTFFRSVLSFVKSVTTFWLLVYDEGEGFSFIISFIFR